MKLALLFAGQGAQHAGMGRDLYEAYPAFRRVMDEADRAVPFRLKELCFEGPDEKLTQTQWREALYLMKMHQIIDVPGAVKDMEDDTPIYIYSTVNLFVTAADINTLIDEYREEEEEHETAEEVVYPDSDQ